jgi:transposase
MSRVTEAGMDGALEEDVQRTEQRAVGEREVRWSARRKEGVVMRLLRGESLDLLARESGQPAGRISAWREEFLAAGREGLKARPLPVEDFALREAQRKVGELSMELDIVRALLERKEHPPFPRRSA